MVVQKQFSGYKRIKLSSGDNLNRGTELMLRRKKLNKPQYNFLSIRLHKFFSILNRGIKINFEFGIDIQSNK